MVRCMRGRNKNDKRVDRILSDIVRDHSLESTRVRSINKAMSKSGGFESRNLSYGVEILRRMQGEKRCTKFLSIVGGLLSTGVRGIIRDMIKDNMFDCVITTCGALDHDIARSYRQYYAGDFRMNDSILLKKKIHRLGNVLVPEASYGSLIEKKVQSSLEELYNSQKERRDFAAYEIINHIGSTLNEDRKSTRLNSSHP